MKTDLLFAYEENLNKEAKRIFDILYKKYENKEKLNMSFDDAIKENMKKEYSYYHVDIYFKVYSHIPRGLTTDPNNIDVLIDKKEGTLRHITNYANFCLKERKFKKNPKKASEKLAKMLIEMEKKDRIGNKSLPIILAENMDILYPGHNDSVDAKAIVLYLQNALEKNGYTIKKIEPLELRKV